MRRIDHSLIQLGLAQVDGLGTHTLKIAPPWFGVCVYGCLVARCGGVVDSFDEEEAWVCMCVCVCVYVS